MSFIAKVATTYNFTFLFVNNFANYLEPPPPRQIVEDKIVQEGEYLWTALYALIFMGNHLCIFIQSKAFLY